MTTRKNKLMDHLLQSILIGSIALGLSCSALAQTAAPGARADMKADMPRGEHRDPAKMQARMKEMMAKHQAELHDKLKLTAQQEPAWKTFTDSMTPPAMPMKPEHKPGQNMSSPEQMEHHLTKMKSHLARAEQHLSALKTFYAVLTPEQQKTFDESHRKAMHHMRGMHQKMGQHRPGMERK